MVWRLAGPLLVTLLATGCTAQDYPDRWVFVSKGLTSDEQVAEIDRIVATASEHGLNGMLLSGNLDGLSRWDDERLARLDRVQAICDDAGIELIPLGFSVGYGGSILGHDPNLAAGLRVEDALFGVTGDEAQVIPDPEVEIDNGDFERFTGDRFDALDFHDQPGEVSFVDQETVHDGDAAIRFENYGPPHGHARLMSRVKLSPHRHYLLSAWVKTENLQPASAFRLQVYTEERNLTSFRPSIKPTQDWTRVAFTFNSGDHDELLMYVGLWGGREGRFWIDDLEIEEVGLRCVLRRPGTPITVASEDGETTYEEGVDFATIEDPKLRDYRGNHDDPPLKLSPGSRISDGDRLRVSFYHAGTLGTGQIGACMSEPAVYENWRNQVRLLHERIKPQKYFLSMDEIRAGGSCAACKDRNMTMAEILGDCITKQCEIIRDVNPDAEIYIWSDMLDPNHNAHGDYYLVEGDYTGSWEHVPEDLTIAVWYHEKRVESLKFFSELGYETLAGAYSDGDTLDNPKDWLAELDKTPRARGIMYTTWQSKYGLLADFGDLVRDHEKAAAP
ncbi:MAG TPA: hypothetical protein QGH10_06670 [Armatimonadota bacterium]|nr:hypothetical protein [Armatimonadota bacterium]